MGESERESVRFGNVTLGNRRLTFYLPDILKLFYWPPIILFQAF